MANNMYNETTRDTYFEGSSSLITSIFRANRYFLGRKYIYHIRMNQKVRKVLKGSIRNDFGLPPIYDSQTYITTIIYPTTRNSSYFEVADSGFMIDPVNFVAEIQADQRNKNARSVTAIKRWGIIDRIIFRDTTLERLRRIGLNPESLANRNNNDNIENNIASNEEIIELLNEEINA
ncbi:hypothetical protein C1645_802245 [Glomus cerebriforme]|uniref:Uncharacterized protein n=1 Tax=Glomus cerebriforme TaxID=658196 RepID=A0A397TFM1_9GLOM|nr:hypothetical protein C1645_802245 [Glomus cerebriforme]